MTAWERADSKVLCQIAVGLIPFNPKKKITHTTTHIIFGSKHTLPDRDGEREEIRTKIHQQFSIEQE